MPIGAFYITRRPIRGSPHTIHTGLIMHLILTHEQTDFDALASLLGAHLLNEEAIPVLPSRMNRNLRAFLTLYGVDLPFVERRDLPPKKVERITLVDTQSLTSVRGMHEGTRICVVDHHARREDIPASWEIHTEAVGANTTLFVESLQTRGITLTSIQATLLLLGIYEDTGSLTYSRTTARDVRAAAYLLEQGASLSIAIEFLNHPLSLAQEAIYRTLQANASVHHINGHTIIISHADARQSEEELSTIAHKLRNVLEPDGLFLLIETRGGVQLIARSISERVDAGGVAREFGGGGHPRAAAALIRDMPLQAAQTRLREILPRFVRPPITVRQIMSRGPQVLSPETPARQAARAMRRYGYEGYPVVQDGRVIGLLTRRAVDRALSHDLNLPARSLMLAGEVSVQPDDSIEHLQHIMTQTGWGQIPVVSPQDSSIIGIVTRTDLLKTLSPQRPTSGLPNMADRLESALPPQRLRLLKQVIEAATEMRFALYIVGGFVRDLLLGHPSMDFDLVVEGDAIALGKALQSRYGGKLTTHKRFGTAKWFLPPSQASESTLPFLDLISARTEFYTHPTALPTVERGSIKLDLHRRDFTINTLALRLDGRHYGELHDYWGGLPDLRKGLIRVLHSLSFVDDPTRMLRAVRFEQRFGFQIESRTLELLQEARPLMARVSGDRIRHELDHILDEPRAVPMLARLHSLELRTAIHPALPWDETIAAWLMNLPYEPPPPEWEAERHLGRLPLPRALAYTLWLLRLPEETARQIGLRLKMPRHLQNHIERAARVWNNRQHLASLSPSALTFTLEEWRAFGLPLYACYRVLEDDILRERLHACQSTWRHIHPHINGEHLKARGLPPGPHFKRILTTLRAAWLDGHITSPQEERSLLEKLLAENT
ncbi:MAG: CBS domain-containing protein [Anaerolineae bacterium]|nr:MAG: CBS domain-containing protein [Anaerolineae bacterium]